MGSHGSQGGSEKQTRLSVPSVKEVLPLKCSALNDEWKFFWESLISKVEICCPMRLALSKSFLLILMIRHNVGFS